MKRAQVQAENAPLLDTGVIDIIQWLTQAADACNQRARRHQEKGEHIDACWFYGKEDAYRMAIQALQ